MIDPGDEERNASRGSGAGAGAILAYLSPRGRVSRHTWAIRFVLPCVAAVIGLSGVLDRGSVAGLALFLCLYWAYLAGLAKRLQDLGLPGLPVAAVVVLGLWLQLESGLDLPTWLQAYVYALFLVVLIFAASTSSEPRANRYGPRPASVGRP